LANLASRHALPMTTATREITDAGGLMSYGANIPDAWRQAGVYAARLLKGVKATDLPVVQATKMELAINVQTARTLKLGAPYSASCIKSMVEGRGVERPTARGGRWQAQTVANVRART
jgi:ABC-type uncharacterized transport system substrate-binding protein